MQDFTTQYYIAPTSDSESIQRLGIWPNSKKQGVLLHTGPLELLLQRATNTLTDNVRLGLSDLDVFEVTYVNNLPIVHKTDVTTVLAVSGIHPSCFTLLGNLEVLKEKRGL